MSTEKTRTDYSIRAAVPDDLAQVHQIYSYYVLNELATFEETPPTIEELVSRHASIVGAGLPYLVTCSDGTITGYAYATLYRPRPAYRYTVEDSVYVRPGFHGRGIGSSLLQFLIQRCEVCNARQMVAVIGNRENIASIALHRRLGFHEVGILQSVGFKLGRWVDTVVMQRPLGLGDSVTPDFR
jgi:L-amino acid N-acyltransferase YncA